MTEQTAPAPALLDLPTLRVPADKLRPNPWNPNKMSTRIYEAERESIRTFGFIDPISVMIHPDEPDAYMIIDGEHRWKAAQDEGYGEVLIVVLDVTVEQAKKLTIVLNETRGDADVVLLGQLLNDLKDLDDFTAGLPFSSSELDHLLNVGAADWDDFAQSPPAADPPPDPGPSGKDITFTLDESRFDRFQQFLVMIRKELGLDDERSDGDVIYEAVSRQARSLNQA